MTPNEQLELWVNGESVHNNEGDECCPDFSCCEEIHTPIELRKKFQKAHHAKDEAIIGEMLTGFLAGMLKNEKVHITNCSRDSG